jgi:signal transduction histidine kinase
MVDVTRLHQRDLYMNANPKHSYEMITVAQEFRQLVQAATSRLSVSSRALVQLGHAPLSELIGEAAEMLEQAGLLAQRLARTASAPASEGENVLVQNLIVSLSDLLRRALGGGIQLQTCVSGETPTAYCPPGLLEQVLIDLAITARECMPGGGLILIECRARPADHGSSQRREVCITVRGRERSEAVQHHVERNVPAAPGSELHRAWGHRISDMQQLFGAVGTVALSERVADGDTCVRLHLAAQSNLP